MNGLTGFALIEETRLMLRFWWRSLGLEATSVD
jgi:hypothetical protein